jgi:hypothetical protein
MKYRVIFRMSLNHDTYSAVRNEVEKRLGVSGIRKRPGKTATWEAGGLEPRALLTVARILAELAEPSKISSGASSTVTVDHIWLYVDRDLHPVEGS